MIGRKEEEQPDSALSIWFKKKKKKRSARGQSRSEQWRGKRRSAIRRT